MSQQAKDSPRSNLGVQVVTTSGAYPEGAYAAADRGDPIQGILEEAAKALGICSTDGWVATINGRPLKSGESYRHNGIVDCLVDIDFGPDAGGGG